jgi:hypothetical protein
LWPNLTQVQLPEPFTLGSFKSYSTMRERARGCGVMYNESCYCGTSTAFRGGLQKIRLVRGPESLRPAWILTQGLRRAF